MNCNPHCPLGTALLAIPFFRVADVQMQQSVAAQLPWWLWLIFVLLALTAIFWWQIFLRPSQAKEMEEIEHLLSHGHETHNPAEAHSHAYQGDMVEPKHETSWQAWETDEQTNNTEAEPANSDNEIEPEA